MKVVSVVTPILNQRNYVEKTIDSVLSQSYKNIEYIIIDGGSTDGTVEIIKKYSKYLKYWESNKDRGQSHAINKGLKKVTGDVFNWLNGDDWYEPEALSIVAESFKDETVNVVCGREKLIYRNRKSEKITPGTTIKEELSDTIVVGHIDQPPTFFRTNMLKKIGPLSEKLHFRMDSELWIRYLLTFGLNGVVKIDDILTNFRIHPDSKTSNYQSKFELEKKLIFQSLSKNIDLEFPIHIRNEEGYQMLFDNSWNNEIIREVIENYCYELLREAYSVRKFDLVQKIYSHIDWRYLNEKKLRHAEKINRRIKFYHKDIFHVFDMGKKIFR